MKEAIAGLTTFVTMAYCLIIIPQMLATPGTGLDFHAVLSATVLVSFCSTLLMGLYANLPYGMSPGMGLSAFFTFTLLLEQKIPWPIALGIVFWSGIIFLLLAASPFCHLFIKAVPQSLRVAATIGIGIFITFVGLKNAAIIVSEPQTLVKLGPLTLKTLLCVLGLSVALFLTHRKNPFAFLTAITIVTLCGWLLGLIETPQSWVSYPDFSALAFKADIWGALKLQYIPAMLSFVFTALFDAMATFSGIAQANHMIAADGQPLRLKQGLVSTALSTVAASMIGTSSGGAVVESYAGIAVGGRTGRTALFTALCFLPCFFFAPAISFVPPYATASVLILVGCSMFSSVRDLQTKNIEEILPAFLTIILIPLTFSITQGVIWGLAAHVICFALCGRAKEISLLLFSIVTIWLALILTQLD